VTLWLLAGCSCHEPTGMGGRGTPSTPDDLSPPDTGDEPGHSAEPLRWVWLDNGYGYSCGLLSDGRLECWGREELVRRARREGLMQFDLAVGSGCGLDALGQVQCWCQEHSRYMCRDDMPLEPGFVKVLAGEYVACAEDADHVLTCWGDDDLVAAPTARVDHWDVEWNGGCAIIGGEIACWGEFEDLWSMAPDADPLPPVGGGFVEVSLGTSHACALAEDGEAHCWGSTGLMDRFPDPPPGPLVHLETGHNITCGFRSDHRMECWYSLPGMLDEWSWPQDEQWAQVGPGVWDACGLTLDGRAICFPAEYESYGEQQVPDLDDL
jgi:hypothetical protein